MTRTRVIEEVQLAPAKDMRKIRLAELKKKKREESRKIFVFGGSK